MAAIESSPPQIHIPVIEPEVEVQPPQPEEFKYKLLTGHQRTDGSYKTDEQLRLEYIHLTDNLVCSMVQGVDVRNEATGEMEKQKPDVVIWLDKSARPLAWLTKELWPTLAVDLETGEIPEMPAFKFVNIDREQWVNKVDPEGIGHMDIQGVDKSIIRSLRSIFVKNYKKGKTELNEDIDTRYSELDNKTILIIDEVKSTGRTMDIAKKFFERAFPTSRIAGQYWMSGITTRGLATGNRDLPVWYQENNVYGRGVNNRDDLASGRSENSTQRLGRWFLSTRFDKTDTSALQLRREFHELAKDPQVPIQPSRDWGKEQFKARAEYLNGAPLEAVIKAIQQIKYAKR